MTVKEYLKQYKTLDGEIERLKVKLKRLEARRGYSSPSGNNIRASSSDKIGQLAGKIVDTEAEIARLNALRAEIESKVEGVADNDFRKLLRMFFLDGYSALSIAANLYHSRETVYRRLNEALAYFEGQYGGEF